MVLIHGSYRFSVIGHTPLGWSGARSLLAYADHGMRLYGFAAFAGVCGVAGSMCYGISNTA